MLLVVADVSRVTVISPRLLLVEGPVHSNGIGGDTRRQKGHQAVSSHGEPVFRAA